MRSRAPRPSISLWPAIPGFAAFFAPRAQNEARWGIRRDPRGPFSVPFRRSPIKDLTGKGLAHLKELKQLEELDLRFSPIVDEALPHLKELTGLQKLHLGYTRITDEGERLEVRALAGWAEEHRARW